MGKISAKKRLARMRQRTIDGTYAISETDAVPDTLLVDINDDAETEDEHESDIDEEELEDWEQLGLDLTQGIFAQIRWKEGADNYLTKHLYTGKL